MGRKGSFMRRIIITLVVYFILTVSLSGQTILSYKPGPADPSFRVNSCVFYNLDKDIDRLEVYYQVYNSDLLFERDGENFRADYSIAVSVYTKGNTPVASQSRNKEIILDQYNRTISTADFRTGQFNFELPPGKYKVECHLIDNKSRKTTKRTFDVALRKFNNRNPQISGIEFVFAVDTVAYDSSFLKNNLTVIPNVGRVFGEDTSSNLSYYFEIYPGNNKTNQIHIETSIYNGKLKLMYRDTMSTEFDNPTIAQFRQIGLRDLKADQYYVDIVIKGRRGKELDKFRESFFIYWSPEAMVLNDYKTAVQQLKYVATSREMKDIEKLDNSAERLKEWNKFWESKDPTPGTVANEAKLGYYQRIEYANRRFTVMRREGWRTDRGMIYIMYGEPDQIEDFPFELDSRAYQIWHYYSTGSKPREFLFVDEWGNNDFILQYPYDGLR